MELNYGVRSAGAKRKILRPHRFREDPGAAGEPSLGEESRVRGSIQQLKKRRLIASGEDPKVSGLSEASRDWERDFDDGSDGEEDPASIRRQVSEEAGVPGESSCEGLVSVEEGSEGGEREGSGPGNGGGGWNGEPGTGEGEGPVKPSTSPPGRHKPLGRPKLPGRPNPLGRPKLLGRAKPSGGPKPPSGLKPPSGAKPLRGPKSSSGPNLHNRPKIPIRPMSPNRPSALSRPTATSRTSATSRQKAPSRIVCSSRTTAPSKSTAHSRHKAPSRLKGLKGSSGPNIRETEIGNPGPQREGVAVEEGDCEWVEAGEGCSWGGYIMDEGEWGMEAATTSRSMAHSRVGPAARGGGSFRLRGSRPGGNGGFGRGPGPMFRELVSARDGYGFGGWEGDYDFYGGQDEQAYVNEMQFFPISRQWVRGGRSSQWEDYRHNGNGMPTFYFRNREEEESWRQWRKEKEMRMEEAGPSRDMEVEQGKRHRRR
ncbi:hypothetical protein XELAEV_18027367mg [Xenopus laevis]|uniref:Uncharacterized protein n=1 Tax=Xenopus laevis TaxID=8355 RepID=A0A974CXD7_XENLA|nr:hypothetical protein XELAEV_18027367mg [Xenopus laevis]